jgi:hypothetical protein
VNDRVYLNSNHDIRQFRHTVKTGACLLVFTVIGVAAEYTLAPLGPKGWIKPLGLGLVFALITFAGIQRYYKKRPAPLSAAQEILTG